MSNCITCRAPLLAEGFRKDAPYVCPYCGSAQPLQAQDAAELEYQAAMEEAGRLLRSRRFEQAREIYKAQAALRENDVDALVGLLLCAYQVTELEALARCSTPLGLMADTLTERILALDEELGDRLLELDQHMKANWRAKLRRGARIGAWLLTGVLTLAALISYVIPSLLLAGAQAEIRRQDYPTAFLLTRLAAGSDAVVPPSLRARGAALLDEALADALERGADFAATEDVFCVLEDGAVRAVSGHIRFQDLFPGTEAEKIGVSGRTVYCLGSDGWVLSRDLSIPGGKPEPTGARDFRTDALGAGVVLISTAGHPTACQRYTHLEEVTDTTNLLTRLLHRKISVETAFQPAAQFSGNPADLLVGQGWMIGVFGDHLEAVRSGLDAKRAPADSIPWQPDAVDSLCCGEWYTFAVSDGRVLRYPESGSHYTDGLSGVAAVAAQGQRSAVLFSSGQYQSDAAFDRVIRRNPHLAASEITIVMSPYTGSAMLLIR